MIKQTSIAFTYVLFVFFSVQLQATTTPLLEAEIIENKITTKKTVEANGIKTKKKGIFKRWIQNVLIKKLKKKLAKREYNQYTKSSEMAFVLGIMSFIGFWALLLAGPSTGFGFIVVGLAALAADILSIRILSRTRNNKSEFKRERSFAHIGLIFALLTGIIPLLALIIVLLSI